MDKVSQVGEIVEMPVTDALAIDPILGRSPGIPKLRRQLIDEFGWQSHVVSLGKWGRLSLNTAPLLGCVATAWRWDRERASALGHSYNEEGLKKLLKTTEYRRLIGLIKMAVQRAIRARDERPNVPLLLRGLIGDLITTNREVRDIAEQMTEIAARVDRRLGQVQRFVGHVERVEEDEALVVLESARKELRAVDRATLAATGITAPGDVFALYEYRWSPDTVTSLYAPAVPKETPAERQARLEQWARELAGHETPLPRRSTEAASAAEKEAGASKRDRTYLGVAVESGKSRSTPSSLKAAGSARHGSHDVAEGVAMLPHHPNRRRS